MSRRSSRDGESTNDDEHIDDEPIDHVGKFAKFWKNPENKLQTTGNFSRSLVFLRTNRIKCLIRETFGIIDKNISYLKIKNEENNLSIDLGTEKYYAKLISRENRIIYLINVDSDLEKTGEEIVKNLGKLKINYFFVSPDDKSLRSVSRIIEKLKLENIEDDRTSSEYLKNYYSNTRGGGPELPPELPHIEDTHILYQKNITVLPCSHELSFKKTKCDGNQSYRDSVYWRQSRSGCLNKTSKKHYVLNDICKMLNIETSDYRKVQFNVDWSLYHNFYDKNKNQHCRNTNLFELIDFYQHTQTVIQGNYAKKILDQRDRVKLMTNKKLSENIVEELELSINIVEELEEGQQYLTFPNGKKLLTKAKENISDLYKLFSKMKNNIEIREKLEKDFEARAEAAEAGIKLSRDEIMKEAMKMRKAIDYYKGKGTFDKDIAAHEKRKISYIRNPIIRNVENTRDSTLHSYDDSDDDDYAFDSKEVKYQKHDGNAHRKKYIYDIDKDSTDSKFMDEPLPQKLNIHERIALNKEKSVEENGVMQAPGHRGNSDVLYENMRGNTYKNKHGGKYKSKRRPRKNK